MKIVYKNPENGRFLLPKKIMKNRETVYIQATQYRTLSF